MIDTDNRLGPWMQMSRGQPFWPLDIRPHDIHIEDIAHQLALENRFSGAVLVPYSVAEHSYRVAHYVRDRSIAMGWTGEKLRNAVFAALTHDIEEGTGWRDMARPIKYWEGMAEYRHESKRSKLKIFEILGVDYNPEVQALVKEGDNTLLATEKRDVMAPSLLEWEPLPEPLATKVEPHYWNDAKDLFLEMYHEYKPGGPDREAMAAVRETINLSKQFWDYQISAVGECVDALREIQGLVLGHKGGNGIPIAKILEAIKALRDREVAASSEP